MPLDKQIVGVSFTQGLDTQTDKRIVLPGRMVALQNATMSESDTFRRRNGGTPLDSGTAFSGLARHNNQLLAVDSATIYSYSSADSNLNASGTISTVTLAEDELVHTTGIQDLYDCASSGGLTCYIWRDYLADYTLNGVKYQIIDEATGAAVVAPTLLNSAGYSPRVVAVTGAFLLLYGGAATTIKGRVVPLATPATLGAETTLASDFSPATPVMDAVGLGAAGFVYYVCSNASANSTKAFSVTYTGTTPAVAGGPTVVTTNAVLDRANTIGMAIAAFDASTLVCAALANAAAGAGPGMWSAIISDSVSLTFAATRQDATAAPTGNYGALTAVLNGSTMWIYSDDAGSIGAAAATKLIRRTGINASNAQVSASATWALSAVRANGTNGPFIASKAFLVGSTVYIPVFVQEAGTGALQNSWFLLTDAAVPVARALYGTFGLSAGTTINFMQASAPTLASGAVVALVREVGLLSFSGGTIVTTTGLNRLRVAVNSATPMIRDQIGPTSYFANGILSVWDGLATTEAAFNLFPEVVSAAQGGAGGVVTAGVHQIVALYEWFDAAGQRHQSSPSVAISYTAADSIHHCTITVPTLFLSQKTGITIVAFATTAAGTVFYRVNGVNAPVANSTSAATVTVDFNTADTVLDGGEVLYTTGGILPNSAPPACSALAIHQDRVFVNPSDDAFATQYSQPWVSGFGVQWNEALRFYVEATGGRPTAYASIDDKLIVFRPRKIGVLFGQGPSTTGAQNGYQLQDLPTDVGCSEPRSVLVMPEGVIFKSTSKGWYRLGRDLQLQWIGEGVQAFDSAGVTSAVLLDTLRECRFTTASYIADALGNQTYTELIYNYAQKGPDGVGQWSTDQRDRGVNDAVWWPGGNAYVMATDTALLKELPPTAAGYRYGDFAVSTTSGTGGTAPVSNTGSPIVLKWRTGWLKPGDALQAFQRIWRVLLTGAVVGHPQPGTTLKTGCLALATVLEVWDTSVFVADQVAGGGLELGLATTNYETTSAYVITDSTHLTLSAPCANAHLAGATVRGTRIFGARDSLVADFYFDGNDITPFQTITISDVNDLISGNVWNVRLQPNLQKCDAIMVGVTSTPPTIPAQSAGYVDPGGGINFSGMTMELGVKKGARKYNSAQSK